MKELGMEKLCVGWRIRAMRFEERTRNGAGRNIMSQCWLEEEEGE